MGIAAVDAARWRKIQQILDSGQDLEITKWPNSSSVKVQTYGSGMNLESQGSSVNEAFDAAYDQWEQAKRKGL